MPTVRDKDHVLQPSTLLPVPAENAPPMQMHANVPRNCRDVPLLQGHDASDGAHRVSRGHANVRAVRGGPRDRDRRPGPLKLSPNCSVATFVGGRLIRHEVTAHGCTLFQRLAAADPKLQAEATAAAFFREDGTCGAPWGIDLLHPSMLEYLTCITLAAKTDVREPYVARRIRLALRHMIGCARKADFIWDRVLEREWDVLERLDYRVMDLYQPSPAESV